MATRRTVKTGWSAADDSIEEKESLDVRVVPTSAIVIDDEALGNHLVSLFRSRGPHGRAAWDTLFRDIVALSTEERLEVLSKILGTTPLSVPIVRALIVEVERKDSAGWLVHTDSSRIVGQIGRWYLTTQGVEPPPCFVNSVDLFED